MYANGMFCIMCHFWKIFNIFFINIFTVSIVRPKYSIIVESPSVFSFAIGTPISLQIFSNCNNKFLHSSNIEISCKPKLQNYEVLFMHDSICHDIDIHRLLAKSDHKGVKQTTYTVNQATKFLEKVGKCYLIMVHVGIKDLKGQYKKTNYCCVWFLLFSVDFHLNRTCNFVVDPYRERLHSIKRHLKVSLLFMHFNSMAHH
jgi:hypothetical protein